MKYFNGFALQNEEVFFKDKLIESDFSVAGFSYGAQQAFEYVYHSKERVDRLILLSPAFFQEEKKSFIKTQLRYFKADKEGYISQFLKNVVYPSSVDLTPYLAVGKVEELESLLIYVWEKEKMVELLERGVVIEVFLGEVDKIVKVEKNFNFFSLFTTVYLFKEEGHLLKAK